MLIKEKIKALEQQLEIVKNKKKTAVKIQDFEMAASLRDTEKGMQEELKRAKLERLEGL